MKKFALFFVVILWSMNSICQNIDSYVGKYAVTDMWCATLYNPNYCDTSYSNIEIEKKSENELAILHFLLYNDTLYATVDSDSITFSQTFYDGEPGYLFVHGSGKLTNDTLVYKYSAGGPSGLFEGICIAVKINDNPVRRKEFAPIGAEWYYEKAESYNPPVFGYVKHKCIKDSVIEGHKVKVLEITHSPNDYTTNLLGYEYILQKGDTIFYWKSGEFHLLYNFASQKGDSLLLYSEMRNQCKEKTNYGWNKVDSTFYQTINNVKLKGYTTVGIQGSIWGFDYFPTIETIGNLGYLFPQNVFCGFYDGFTQIGSLRCYTDDSLGFFQFNERMRCDSTTNYPVGVELFARQHLFQLYPNPATHEISVEFDEWQDSDNPVALLYDVIGNLKIETTIHACKTAIDLSGLFPGSYILIIKANKGVIDYEKFIKN